MIEKILQIKNLKIDINTLQGPVRAVNGVSLEIKRGETFGLVGESGSGKTMTALSILRLVPTAANIVDGEILFGSTSILNMEREALRRIRGYKIVMVFQEPASSLNPVFTIGEQIAEAVITHQYLSDRSKATEMALESLNNVHISKPKKVFYDYPHQLSGGTKQRAMIAMALVNSPELLILDEPTTALDVTIQAQILDLLSEIIEKENLSILFISHDFGIIAKMCDRVGVMRKGRLIETADVNHILYRPSHPYTVSLLESVKALS